MKPECSEQVRPQLFWDLQQLSLHFTVYNNILKQPKEGQLTMMSTQNCKTGEHETQTRFSGWLRRSHT